MDISKTPPQPPPFLPPVPGAHEVPVIARSPQNTRGPESTGPAPMPPPFRSPSPQHVGGSLSVPTGSATEIAHRMGLEHPGEAPKPAGLGGKVLDRPSEITMAATHQQMRDFSRKYAPR
jgi:hypothetical protein